MRKIIYIGLIIFGIGMICYPKILECYYDYKMNEIMKNLELKDTQNKEIKTKKYEDNSKGKEEVCESEDTKIQGATIKIEKINLYQPILEESSEENLKISISSINKGVKPGENGNYALAGHRSHTYGRNFNRLDELEINDKIEISDGKNKYLYIIDKKFLVEPNETWVLESKNYDEITMITCHPMINPTHRLVIKGKIYKISK